MVKPIRWNALSAEERKQIIAGLTVGSLTVRQVAEHYAVSIRTVRNWMYETKEGRAAAAIRIARKQGLRRSPSLEADLLESIRTTDPGEYARLIGVRHELNQANKATREIVEASRNFYTQGLLLLKSLAGTWASKEFIVSNPELSFEVAKFTREMMDECAPHLRLLEGNTESTEPTDQN